LAASARRRYRNRTRLPLVRGGRHTVYLKNGGLLEHAQQMAAHESARTTKLYDRRSDKVTLDEVERIVL